MTSLLDSRVHHRRIRILSRKAQESIVHDEDPPNRRFPLTPSHTVSPATSDNSEELTARQRGQRLRRQREKAVREFRDAHESDEHIPVAHSEFSASDELTRRERGQMLRWERVRSERDTLSRNVSTLLTAHLEAR